MDKPPNPNYLYIDSAELKQRVAFHKESGWLFCQDRYPDGNLVRYSPRELAILEKSGEPISMSVHRVKMFFTGEIVGYERNGTGNNDSGKSETGTKPDDPNNNSSQGGQIQNASGVRRPCSTLLCSTLFYSKYI